MIEKEEPRTRSSASFVILRVRSRGSSIGGRRSSRTEENSGRLDRISGG
jgi:hypothetical protein